MLLCCFGGCPSFGDLCMPNWLAVLWKFGLIGFVFV